jgi:3-deoxy-D-manno-octulosonate 8-phosphate phosphatase (KDO 8-P phosphatase)
MSEHARQRACDVKLMIFDVDGVLTDGRLHYSDRGEEMKAFHVLDGHGLKMLRESGVEVAILTARRSAIVERRAQELGISLVRQGATNKLEGFEALLAQCRCLPRDAGYAGDDVVDLPVLGRCGFSASVPDAPEAVRSRVHLVTRSRGGEGAVRELCEYIMTAQGTLEAALAPYLA